MNISRRDAMKRGGEAVVVAAAISVSPTIAVGASGDAKLLSRIEAFWAAHNEAAVSSEKWIAEKKRVEALPECPPFLFPEATREDHQRYFAFLVEHGVDALADASNKANKRQGKAIKAVFDIPATTYQGVLGKFQIVHVAYGNGTDIGNDVDLECWQDHAAPWLENAIGDFERLAGHGRAI